MSEYVRLCSKTGDKADMREVAFVPNPDSWTAANDALFDHLVGAQKECGRKFNADRFCRLQIYDQLVLGRLLIGRSTGFVPLRMLPVYLANRRMFSARLAPYE